jgi:hypothetical protein
MRKHDAAGLLAAATPLLLIACGGAQGQPAARVSSAAVASAWHRYAQCVRDHGVSNLPDPAVDDRGRATFAADAPRVPDDVVQQCSSFLDGLPAQPAARVDVSMRIRFAQCMRQQGIGDFPDPDPQGRFQLPPSLDQGGNLKSSPRWPLVQAAMNGPCKQFDPSGHI